MNGLRERNESMDGLQLLFVWWSRRQVGESFVLCVCVCVCGRIDSIEHVLFLCSLALDCSTEKKAPNTPKERREQQEQREKEGKMLLCCCRAVVL